MPSAAGSTERRPADETDRRTVGHCETVLGERVMMSLPVSDADEDDAVLKDTEGLLEADPGAMVQKERIYWSSRMKGYVNTSIANTRHIFILKAHQTQGD